MDAGHCTNICPTRSSVSAFSESNTMSILYMAILHAEGGVVESSIA